MAQAIGAVQAADNQLSAFAAQSMLVAGFNNDVAVQRFLANGRIFATVDQLTITPHVGIWNTLPRMIEMCSTRGFTSVAQIQRALGIEDNVFRTSMLPIPSDVEGFLLQVPADSRLLTHVYNMPLPLRPCGPHCPIAAAAAADNLDLT